MSVFISGYISDRTQLRKLTLSFGSLIVGLIIMSEALLPRNTPFTTVLLMYSVSSLLVGFIYPSWCAIFSEHAEDINPFSVGRAFGIAGILNIFTGIILSILLPLVVKIYGWNVWMIIAACFSISNIFFISFARGPWFRTPRVLAQIHGSPARN